MVPGARRDNGAHSWRVNGAPSQRGQGMSPLFEGGLPSRVAYLPLCLFIMKLHTKIYRNFTNLVIRWFGARMTMFVDMCENFVWRAPMYLYTSVDSAPPPNGVQGTWPPCPSPSYGTAFVKGIIFLNYNIALHKKSKLTQNMVVGKCHFRWRTSSHEVVQVIASTLTMLISIGIVTRCVSYLHYLYVCTY